MELTFCRDTIFIRVGLIHLVIILFDSQGYHDVAITFLLVVGEEVAFHVMEILSTNHLVECMQETMEPTQHRLMYLYPIIRRESAKLCEYLLK